ncbi:MAG: enoyl-CoA hydratase/isomerase family protein [Candidatus Thorarchaeota archaeon]|jgi:enoyl-CoA hydratase
MDGEIIVTREDPIAIVTISRPNKLNSVTHDMFVSFEEKASQLTNDPEVAAIIFTGVGEKAFSAGFDLEMMMGLSPEEYMDFFILLEKTTKTIREAKTCITLAAINGYAVGFGAMVASACDFRFFSKTGALRFPEIDLSIFPGMGAASNLLHLVGPSRAKDLLLSGRTIEAEEALQIGLADRVFEHAELLEKTMEYAKELTQKDRKILFRTKTLVDGMTGKTVFGAMEMESAYSEEWLREKRDE